MEESFNIWNESEPLINEQYEKDNFLICDYNNEDARPYCVIYFSSNGLYYPNTRESFMDFVKNDRYEWRKHHFHNVRREIYVRDIVKQWYIKGINSRISTVDKLIEWLSCNIPKDCDTITVGNSAGGYMAVLAACMLDARYSYNFSGQFSLEDILEDDNPLHNTLFKKRAERIQRRGGELYLNLTDLIKKAADLDVFYFYPALSAKDNLQCMNILDLENVHQFAFKADKHGETMYKFNIDDVFDMEPEQLLAVSERLGGKIVSRSRFSVYVRGIPGTCEEIIRKALKK